MISTGVIAMKKSIGHMLLVEARIAALSMLLSKLENDEFKISEPHIAEDTWFFQFSLAGQDTTRGALDISNRFGIKISVYSGDMYPTTIISVHLQIKPVKLRVALEREVSETTSLLDHQELAMRLRDFAQAVVQKAHKASLSVAAPS